MRIEIPADKTFVHETIIPLRWGDMDAFGHVNNTLYFRYSATKRPIGLQVVRGWVTSGLQGHRE